MSGINTNPFAPGHALPAPPPARPEASPPGTPEADHGCHRPHPQAPDASRVDAAAAQAGRMGQTGAMPIAPPGGPAPANEPADAFLKRVYREELGRAPDAEGFAAWMKNLEGGMSRDELRMHFQLCPEAQMPETKARKAWQGSMAGAEGKDPVETIKADPRYAEAKVDTTSLQTATESASQWVMARFPDLVDAINKANNAVPENKQKSRQLCYELTGHLIGVLRANGVDAQRLVRQSHNDYGNPNRYVNDAFVLPDGRAIDWLGGEGTERQFHDLDVPSPKTDRNFGVVERAPGAPLSSSTLGV